MNTSAQAILTIRITASKALRHIILVKCATVTKSPYARGWYLFSFANDSFRSATSANDAQSLWPPAVKILEDLSRRAKWADIRTAAAESLKLAKRAEEQTGIH
jgi:hypothetical protein